MGLNKLAMSVVSSGLDDPLPGRFECARRKGLVFPLWFRGVHWLLVLVDGFCEIELPSQTSVGLCMFYSM